VGVIGGQSIRANAQPVAALCGCPVLRRSARVAVVVRHAQIHRVKHPLWLFNQRRNVVNIDPGSGPHRLATERTRLPGCNPLISKSPRKGSPPAPIATLRWV
tara:strand:+ start:331 stop:636 length:306 start_codon:yes stop_codon:yes gene_type:complete